MRLPLYFRRFIPRRGLWVPCDAFLAVSVCRDRMLHVPSLLLERYPAHRGNRGYL